MTNSLHRRTRLLVSVQNAREAQAALDGGADFIDVKDPHRGSLGAADARTIRHVIAAVRGKVPVTAAVGELVDASARDAQPLPAALALFKLGLAGCRSLANWRHDWRRAINRLTSKQSAPAPVAVVYADWRAADAPAPDEIFDAAVGESCAALLIDTYDKSRGALFDHWAPEDLGPFLRQVQSKGMLAVVAGSLSGSHIQRAARLAPDVVAVRTAACVGGRQGAVCAEKVRALQETIAKVPIELADPPASHKFS